MKKDLRIRLRAKLTLWFLCLVMLVYTFDSAFAAWLFERQMAGSIGADLERICATIIPDVSETKGHASLRDWDIASKAHHVHRLVCIQLFDPGGKLLEAYGIAGVPRLGGGRMSEGKVSVFSWNIQLADGCWLEAQVPSTQFDDAISKFAWTKLARVITIGLAVGLCGWVYAGKAIEPMVRSLRTLRNFVDDAGHELRTPVTVIENGVETLESELKNPDEATQEVLEIIKRASSRLKGLSNNLLLLAKMEHPEAALRFSTIRVGDVISNVVQDLTERAGAKNIKLTVTPMPEMFLYADRDALARLLTNLIENAINYTPVGGEVVLAANKTDTAIELSVKDTGVGIPLECIPYLFDRFYRVDSSRATAGSGLGLSIVKAIAEAHGGAVRVTSELGKGSNFTVQLPISA